MNDHVVNINISTKNAKSKNIGKCIYCDAAGGKLTREHVLPRGLGGGLILRNASCHDCQKIIHAVETTCMRGMFLPYRLGVGLVKNPDEMPKFSRLIGAGGTALDLPFEATPRHLLLPRPLERAALLECEGVRERFSYQSSLFMSRTDLLTAALSIGAQFGLNVPFDIHAHLRMLAKIAHGTIVFDLGLEGFVPMLREYILGKQSAVAAQHFGLQEWEPPAFDETRLGHQFGWRIDELPSANYVVCQIRLFASHATPPISVVVGTTNLTQEELLQRARA